MTRKNFTPKTKRLVRERANGACEVYRIPEEMRRVRYPMLPEACQRDGADVDHVQPAWMGGEPTLENGAYLCKPCHAIKRHAWVASRMSFLVPRPRKHGEVMSETPSQMCRGTGPPSYRFRT